MQENEVICTPTGHMLSSLENKFQSSTISDEMREFVLNQLLYLPSWHAKRTYVKAFINTRKPIWRRSSTVGNRSVFYRMMME